jgi:transcriptional regulator with XRE-family HTH domain
MRKYLPIGERLKRLRGDLSQEKFAKIIDVSHKGYQRYESGERIPPPHVLMRIAALCNTTIDWILGGDLTMEQALILAWIKEDKDKDLKKYLKKIGSKSYLYPVFLQIDKIFNEGERDKIEAIKAVLAALESDKNKVKILAAFKALLAVFEKSYNPKVGMENK